MFFVKNKYVGQKKTKNELKSTLRQKSKFNTTKDRNFGQKWKFRSKI